MERQSSGYLIEVGQGLRHPDSHERLFQRGPSRRRLHRAACGNHRDNAIIAKRAGVKTLALTHRAQIDQPGIREQIVHEIQQVFDGKVVWGEDLMRLGLSGSCVSTIEPGQHE